MWPGLIESAHIVVLWLLQIIFECPALCTVRQQYTHICIFVFDGQRHHEVLFCILCTIFYVCY